VENAIKFVLYLVIQELIWKIEKNKKYEEIANKVFESCFKEEDLYNGEIYICVILSDEEYIRKINSKFRDIDRVTDVLSFPMFEKDEIEFAKQRKENLGDIIICIKRVQEQAIEYGHSFEREFAYMLVHGFYHLMGYDHMEEDEKKIMREKEEYILSKLEFNK